MVQVDIVWAYAFGAGFGAASARQLRNEDKPFINKCFIVTMLFLSIFFAPSGMYLLWQFPQWETMQVATGHESIPAWFVALFGATNITQGILGYLTTYILARKGRFRLAHMNWMAAWILFWFILACGWDGTGYQRFTYDPSVMGGVLWQPGMTMGIEFFYKSNVWWTLVVMALFLGPMLVYGLVSGVREGTLKDPSVSARAPGRLKILILFFGTQWIICLALAIAAAAIVIKIGGLMNHIAWGYIIGLPLFILLCYYMFFRKNMLMHRIAKSLYIEEPEG